MFTYDEPKTNFIHTPLANKMAEIGGSHKTFNRFAWRCCYLLVGEPGLGEGNGWIEKYHHTFCEVKFKYNRLTNGVSETSETEAVKKKRIVKEKAIEKN